jgi:hypothetical protein
MPPSQIATQKPVLVSANRDEDIASLMAMIDQLQRENLNTTPLPENTGNSPDDDDDDDAKMPATDSMTAPALKVMPPNHSSLTGTLPTSLPTTVNGPSFASLPYSSPNLAHVAPAAFNDNFDAASNISSILLQPLAAPRADLALQ